MPFDDNNETPIKNVSFEEQISWNQENLADTIALTIFIVLCHSI
jgi:hypothetical protein